MYGLKPAPFKAERSAIAWLVMGGQLCALIFAVGGDRQANYGNQNDGENDSQPAKEMQGAVESAGAVVGVDGAAGFLGQEAQREA
jgi:hypothetical protein